MTEEKDLTSVPQAASVPKKRRKLSVVWIIPILAAVVAVGIAVERFLSQGPTITIVFKSAEGIEAGKTFVKYKDVNIGQVKSVKLSEDFQKVVVTVKIDKSAEGLMVKDAKFWIEQPRVSLSGISGISARCSPATSSRWRSVSPMRKGATSSVSMCRRPSPSISREGNMCFRPTSSGRWGSARPCTTGGSEWAGRSATISRRMADRSPSMSS